ncbi:hypothetical protein R1flu_006906 [Riccia fluitans]|uniref:Nucleoporin Nup159/Nup146 N-terminal domain-containing protein n=1 Tax=Riccia fluitans TaxID=41844 RepID=A0ABD1Z0D6_9MARC
METKEVELKKVDDFMFKRIGVDVPMLPDSESFSPDHLPIQALAVSSRFGYCIYANPQGFSVAKTTELIEMATSLKDTSKPRQTAQEKDIVAVAGDSIRVVCLSNDELTLCVCSEKTLRFYDMPTLVQKRDTSTFEVREVSSAEDTFAREFSWSPSDTDAYLLVTSDKKLLVGRLGSVPEAKVENGVLAASWSQNGQHIAYVSENRQLSIASSSFGKSFSFDLPAHLSEEDTDFDMNVDAIRWVRPDSIMIGYVSINSEGEEDGYPLFVLTSQSGDLTEEQSEHLGLVFYQLFPSVDPFVTPSGSGPYMLLDYFKPWEVVVAASRKSIDDHIVLVGWLPENGKDEAYSLELGNDLWLPRIELQESGDDNALVGLAIDRSTVQIQLTDPRDDSGESKLPPCPVLICVTLEGKLSFFSFASLEPKRQLPNLVSAPSGHPESKRSAALSVQPIEAMGEISLPSNRALDDSKRQPAAIQANSPLKREEEKPIQLDSFSMKSKEEGKGSASTLLDGFPKPATSFQLGPVPEPESSKLGLISGASKSGPFPKADGPKLGIASGSPEKGEETVASSLQFPFRPFQDASKTGPSTRALSAPPAFSFNESIRSTSLAPFPKGSEDVSAARPVSLQAQKTSPFIGAAPSFSFNSASSGKSFQAGTSAVTFGGASVPSKIVSSGPVIQPQSASSQVMRSSQTVANFSQRVSTPQKAVTGLQSWPGKDQQPQGRPTGVSDMEAAFISELEKVRRMAEQVDQFMSYIEGRATTGRLENNATFTRQSLEELEQGIHLLSENCKAHRKQLTLEKQNVEDLRDENLRVDAWRIYAKSLMEQKNDSRHQELWTLQKLHPELEMKRKRVLKADQDLKLKIAEMEKHLHSLELKQWQADNARRRPNKPVRNPGLFQSVQNLYNTVNTQMAVAEELSLSLAQQMEALNINWSSAAKEVKTSTAASILKAVGAQPDDVRNSPSLETNGQSPVSKQRLSYSPTLKGASVGSPTRQVPDLFVNMQESTRRRRDSMDATWVESVAPKTTIKRPVHLKPGQGFASGGSSLPATMQGNGIVSDVPVRESGLQPRHIRQVQRTRMATQSPNLSLSPQGSEDSISFPSSRRMGTSIPQWPFVLQEQQRRPSPTPPSGDFGAVNATKFGSGSSVASVETKEILFKWANTSSSSFKVTSGVPPESFAPSGKQGALSTFEGSSLFRASSASSTSGAKQSFFGNIEETAGNAVAGPATKPRLQGAFDGATSDIMGKGAGYMEGTLQTSKSGTYVSAGSQIDISRRDNNQNFAVSSTAGSTPLVPGPALGPALTGPKPAFPTASVLRGSTPGSGAFTSSQSVQSVEKSVAAKPESPAGRTIREDESQATLKQSTLTSFSAPVPQKAKVSEDKEPAKQSLLTSGLSGKSIFDFGSKAASGVLGGSPSPVTVSSSPGFTFATASAPSTQSQVSKSLFAPVINTPVQTSSSATVSSLSVTPSSAPTPGAATITTTLPSSTAVDKSDLKAPTPTVPSPAVQGSTSTSSNLFPFPSAATGFKSEIGAASTGVQASTISGITSDAGKSFLASTSSAPTTTQSAVTPFSTSSISTTAQTAPSAAFTSVPSQTAASPFASPSNSGFTAVGAQPASPFGQSSMWSSSGQQGFTFPSSSSMASAPSVTPAGLVDNSIEEDMEEEASAGTSMVSLGGFGGFGGLGLGGSDTPAQNQKTSPFGGSLFGTSPAPTLSPPSGGLFRPAAFSLPAAQSSSTQQTGGSSFGSGFGSPGFSQNLFSPIDANKPFGSPSQSSPGGFGQPAQLGPGQQALGSALGSFGQTRQMGFGAPSIGAQGGFGAAPQGGGFASAATGGGFAGAASGGGFASAATGGGFASAATGGGFAGAASGGGFAGLGAGGGFGNSGGGFQGFAGNQAAQPFGGGVQASLFTQMRK